MEGVALVGLVQDELVFFPIQREGAASDAVGDAADERAEERAVGLRLSWPDGLFLLYGTWGQVPCPTLTFRIFTKSHENRFLDSLQENMYENKKNDRSLVVRYTVDKQP